MKSTLPDYDTIIKLHELAVKNLEFVSRTQDILSAMQKELKELTAITLAAVDKK